MSSFHGHAVAFSVLLLAACLFICVACDLQGDAKGLLALKHATDLGNVVQWIDGATSNVCQWQGVQCTGSTPRVTSVRLPGVGLLGPIPNSSLGQLTELRVISLRSNRLTGSLPSDLTSCRFVRSIYFQNNDLSGPLPSDFTRWPNLVHVDVSSNNFSGSIPTSLSNLTRLKSLMLQGNVLSGSIPPLQISSLQRFNVANNQLSGPIPDTVTLHNFDSSAFVGNNLCGTPLPLCKSVAPVPSPSVIVGVLLETRHRKKLNDGVIAGIVIASIFSLSLIAFACFIALKKGKLKVQKGPDPYEVRSASSHVLQQTEDTAASSVRSASEADRNNLVFFKGTKYSFDLEDLLRASAEVLGRGAVGTSYKAVLESGTIVAVKRLRDVRMERKDFEQQIAILGKLKHVNLVPLIAFYYSKEEKLLISEYMSNGSLSALLHGNKGVNKTTLDWDSRVQIAQQVAHAIGYIHSYGFSHGSIKSSNVLLMNDYSSCVSDHGLALLVNTTSASNKIGGYRAPEVMDVKRVSTKADVYSYGVLLLELLTGKVPLHASMSDEGVDLPKWVQSAVKVEEQSMKVFDLELMRFNYVEEEMVSMLHIAMACVANSPDQRPTMKEVRKMVENIKKPEEDNGGLAPSSGSGGLS